VMRPLARTSLFAVSLPSSMRVTPQHMPVGDLKAMFAPDRC
jgi:hypothetical protein